MNRESTIINFVKENFRLLQQKDFPEDLYKKIKHEYFYERMRNIIGKPKNSEIAHVAVFYMIRKHLIKSDESLTELLDLPFFDNNLPHKELYHEALKLKNPESYVIVDPSRIDESEYRSTIEQELRKKVLQENEVLFKEEREKYQHEIDDMKKQLATIPTILEAEEYKEPQIEQDNLETKPEWWQLLNLKDDPFPLAEGLKRIDKSLREHIVVKTDIFNRYVHFASSLEDQVFKNTIFYGDFGSGKTAFFDYLGEILVRNKIMPTLISLWPVLDVDTNIHTFEQALLYKLQDECIRFKVNTEEPENASYQQRIRYTLRALRDQKGFSGFVIFIDDLHKNPKAFDAVIDFLSYLQIFTANMTGEADLRLALFVAGVPHWRSRISSDPRLSGSLIREEVFPVISELDAYNMLNKRLMVYSKNQDKKNIIGPGFVKQVYESLKSSQQTITFREFIKSALAEFKNGNFDILTVNPNAIPTPQLHAIKDILLTRPKLNYQFEKLLSLLSNANAENRQRCFGLLGSIHLDGSLSEKSQKFERNRWALQQLERCGLIRPVQGAETKWVVGKEMLEANKEILDRYAVSMEDYLIPIFVGSLVSRKSIETPEIEVLNSLVQEKIPDEAKSMITEAVRLHGQLAEIDRTHRIDIVPKELVERCVLSLSYLTKAFFICESIPNQANDDLEELILWNDFWYQLPSVTEFTNQVIENKNSPDITQANYIFSLYKEAFESLADFLKAQNEKDRLFMITYRDLTTEDCKVIYQAREDWFQKQYFEAAAGVAEHIEVKIRETLFNILLLLYGPFEKRVKRFDDESIRKRLFVNIGKDGKKGFARASNELQYLDRKDYKGIMTNATKLGHQNWEEIFKHIVQPWDEDTLSAFLNRFADYNTATSHMKTEVITAEQQNTLLHFIVDSMSFLQKMNQSYRILLDKGHFERDKIHFFSLDEFQDRQSLTGINVTSQDAKKLTNRFTQMGDILLSVNNVEFLETFYNMDYRTIIATISRLLKVTQPEFEKAGVRLHIVKDRSPLFHVRLDYNVNKMSP